MRNRAAGFAAISADDVLEPEAAAVEAALEQHGQRRLHAGDASPRRAEVASVFNDGSARRVIRGDDIDLAVEHFAPQLRVLVRIAQRRRALGGDAELLEIVLGEKQIVRTGFDRHVDAARARFGGHRDAAARADVNDVQLRAGLAGDIDGARDRLELGLDRARGEEVAARVDPVMLAASASRHLLALGVDGHRQAEPRRLAHAVAQRLVVGVRETPARPESHMNALKPTTPRSAIAAI